MSRLNAEMRRRAIGKADASIGFLEKELNTTTVVATREAISRLIEVQIKQRMLANVTDEYAFRIVDRALPPDKIDVLKPKKALMLFAGLAVGLLVGSAVVLAVDGVGGRKRRTGGAGI
jgi:LPS O-antigen subunit length determinant protein (WzzB/FepE family)